MSHTDAEKKSLLAEYRRRAAIVDAASKRSAKMERDFLEKKVLNAQANEALEDFGHKRAQFGEWLLQVSDDLIAECLQSTRAAKAYVDRNPLGGPARMFEAMAERIRAGEDYYAVLADYGLAPVSETPRGDTAKISAMVEALSARKMQLFYKLADENWGELLAALRSNGGSAKVLERPKDGDEAKDRIDALVREVEIICDEFGYDPCEWLECSTSQEQPK